MGQIIELVKELATVTPLQVILNPQIIIEPFQTVVYFFAKKELNPVNILANSIVNPIRDIFSWLLYNFITPILLIVFLILFFVGQYYLIKLNITLIKYTFINIVKLVNFVLDSPRIKGFITTLKEELE